MTDGVEEEPLNMALLAKDPKAALAKLIVEAAPLGKAAEQRLEAIELKRREMDGEAEPPPFIFCPDGGWMEDEAYDEEYYERDYRRLAELNAVDSGTPVRI